MSAEALTWLARVKRSYRALSTVVHDPLSGGDEARLVGQTDVGQRPTAKGTSVEVRAGAIGNGRRATEVAGPAELVLMASVARRYYVDNCSKVEIAEEFGISRFKVARLLDTAREAGVVRIEIGWPGAIDLDLSAALRERLHLLHAIVIDTPETDQGSLRTELGAAAAELLEEIVTDHDVLGLAWARSVSAMTASLRQLPAIPVVQLTGALSRPDIEDSSIELVREVSSLSGGPAYLFYAPLVVADASTAHALRRQPEVARAFRQFGAVTKAVAGIGKWGPGQSTVYDATGERERRRLVRDGVVADVSGIFLDSNGTPVQTPLSERMIGISAAQMAAVPEVIGIAYGESKASAVLAAVRSGLVKGLVTHASLARELLAAADVPRLSSPASGRASSLPAMALGAQAKR